MADLFMQSSFTESDIQQLIIDGTEETVSLEFKAMGSLEKNDLKRAEMAKDISAFANADGGILIYGIEEKNHKAHALSFIDGTIYTKEWIETIIVSKIQRRISEFTIYPIRFNGDLKQSIYVIKISASTNAPHISSDKRFYKRVGVTVQMMEEYDIRFSMNRKHRTALLIGDIIVSGAFGGMQSGGRQVDTEGKFEFQIINIGNNFEENFKVEITLPRIPFQNLREKNSIHQFINRTEGELLVFSIPNKSPIFPGESTTVATVYLKLTKRDYMLLENPGIKVKLYYTGGNEERIFKPLDQLTLNGTRLEDVNWES